MSDNSEPSRDFDKLVAAFPTMAEAIKVFDSPQVQAHAFDALVRALGDRASVPETRQAEAPRLDASAKAEAPRLPSDLSVGEFIEHTGAKRMVDKIVAIGLYLEGQGAESFTREDVRKQFEAAREPLSKNMSRDFGAAVAIRYIAARSGSPKDFYVTTTGKAASDAKFAAKSRKRMPTKRGARKRPSKDKAD